MSVAYSVYYDINVCALVKGITSCEIGNKVVDPITRIACGVVSLQSAERQNHERGLTSSRITHKQ